MFDLLQLAATRNLETWLIENRQICVIGSAFHAENILYVWMLLIRCWIRLERPSSWRITLEILKHS